MKRLIVLSILVVFALSLTGCGGCARVYDNMNYSSLTGEQGNITFYPANGNPPVVFENAKVTYSNSDATTVWIECAGKKFYLQGSLVMEIK